MPAGTANEYSRYVSGEASVGSCSRDESNLTAGRPGSADPTAGGAAEPAAGAAAPGAGAVVLTEAFDVGAELWLVFAAPEVCFASSVGMVTPFFEGPFDLSAVSGRGGTDFIVAGADDAGDGPPSSFGSVGAVGAVGAAEDVGGADVEGGLGATPALGSFASGAVTGMSSGARLTTKRTRASGSTARYPSSRSSIEKPLIGPSSPRCARAACNARCHDSASTQNF